MTKLKIEAFYDKNYKKLMLIPILLLLISIGFLIFNYMQTGEFVEKDVSLKGGITSTIYTEKEVNINEIENLFEDASVRRLSDFATGRQIGIIVEVSNVDAATLKQTLEEKLNMNLDENNYSVEETGSSLGSSFFNELIIAVLVAFIFMGIAVFIAFRTFIPSIAVIVAALMDIIITLAIIDILGMKISTAGIVAFLLIIGYSIDTDILLTTRTLKRKDGKLFERMYESMKTGLTMTFSTISALLIATLFTNSIVLKEMFTIIIIALFVDIVSTYLTNTGILKLYLKNEY